MADFNIAPLIVATNPKDNAENVSIETRAFSVTFNTDLDRSEIENHVSIENADGIKLPAKISYDKKVLTFTLVDGASLKPATGYKITLRGDEDLDDGFTTGLRSIFGKPMAKSFAISFKTEAVGGPEAPVAISPVPFKAMKGRPEFVWTDTGAVRYEIEVAKDTLFERIHWGNQYATSPATPNAATDFLDGTYYWRVRGIGPNEKAGEWSATNVFAVDSLDLGTISPSDTLPPQVEYDHLDADEYIEILDTFPAEGNSNIKTTLKTISFRVLGEVAVEDIGFDLVGESIFGEEADHGELECEVEAIYENGVTTFHVTVPILA